MKFVILCILSLLLTGCTVIGVGRDYKIPDSNQKISLNAKVNGRTLKASVIVDDKPLITHRFTPFVNSTITKQVEYKKHKIRVTFKMIKSIGTSTVVIVIFIDEQLAADFVF